VTRRLELAIPAIPAIPGKVGNDYSGEVPYHMHPYAKNAHLNLVPHVPHVPLPHLQSLAIFGVIPQSSSFQSGLASRRQGTVHLVLAGDMVGDRVAKVEPRKVVWRSACWVFRGVQEQKVANRGI
jgi:hypothetical protein